MIHLRPESIVIGGIENRAGGFRHVNDPSARLATFQWMRPHRHLFAGLQTLSLNAGPTQRDRCLGCDSPFDSGSFRLWHHELNESVRVSVGQLLHPSTHLHLLVLLYPTSAFMTD